VVVEMEHQAAAAAAAEAAAHATSLLWTRR